MNMYGEVIHQTLVIGYKLIAGDSINYLTAEFKFSDEWDGLVKYATFDNGTGELYQVDIVDNKIDANAGLNLPDGWWDVSVIGDLYTGLDDHPVEKRITTNTVRIRVERSGHYNNGFPEHECTLAEQIVTRAFANAENAKAYLEQTKTESERAIKEMETILDIAETIMNHPGWAEFWIDSDGYLNLTHSNELELDFQIGGGYLEVVMP